MPARLSYLLEHRIHQLWKQGLTAQEIADTLGDDSPSRQSIIRIRDFGVRPTLNNRLSSPETIGYAVAAVLVEHQTHAAVAKTLKVPNDSIGRWVKQARSDLADTDTGAVPCLVDTLTLAQNGPENARDHHAEEHLHR